MLSAVRTSCVLLSEFKFPGARELVSALDMATPKQLAISYLFVGVAYELFDERELGLISKALYFTNSPFPNCRSELRSIARCFQPTNIEAFRRSAFKNLHAGDLPHLDWLLGDGA